MKGFLFFFDCLQFFRESGHVHGEIPEQAGGEKVRVRPDAVRENRGCLGHVALAYEMPEIVVAHYKESLAWLDRLPGVTATVYAKGGGAGIPLPNVGREAHTYLHHIVSRYDSLAPCTVFCQGHPLPHVRDYPEAFAQDYPGFRALGWWDVECDYEGRPQHPGLPLEACCLAVLGEPGPDTFRFKAGAVFAVDRETIRARPLDFWGRALDYAGREPLAAWCLERVWPLIFSSES